MKVIFLDIDGVLATYCETEDDGIVYDRLVGETYLNKSLVANLRDLVESDDDIRIVWSSDWGIINDEIRFGEMNPRIWLERQPWMNGRVLGITPRKLSSEHYHEIKWWLDDHPEVENYVILEDSYFPKDWFGIENHLVETDHMTGFDSIRLLEAKKIINMKFF